MRVVLDTNVVYSGLRSRRGASYRLLSLLDKRAFTIVVSVPLVLEYEAVLLRDRDALGLGPGDVEVVVDFLCSVGAHHDIHFLWRPVLRDMKDDMVLETAVNGGCDAIVTHNIKDFAGAATFDIELWTPAHLLKRVGALS